MYARNFTLCFHPRSVNSGNVAEPNPWKNVVLSLQKPAEEIAVGRHGVRYNRSGGKNYRKKLFRVVALYRKKCCPAGVQGGEHRFKRCTPTTFQEDTHLLDEQKSVRSP